MQFSIHDLIQFLGYAVTLVFFFANISAKLKRQGEKIEEIQAQLKDQNSERRIDDKERELRLKSLEVATALHAAQIEIIQRQLQIHNP